MIKQWKLHLLKEKKMTYQDLKSCTLKHKPKMSRVPLDDIVFIVTVQLQTLLNTMYKVVGNACTFLLGVPIIIGSQKRWGTSSTTIITSVMSFKVLDRLENLTFVWICGEIDLPSVSRLKNLERLCLVLYLELKKICSIV